MRGTGWGQSGRAGPSIASGIREGTASSLLSAKCSRFLSFPRLFLVMTKSLHLPESSPKLSIQLSTQLRSNKDLSPLLCPFTIQPKKCGPERDIDLPKVPKNQCLNPELFSEGPVGSSISLPASCPAGPESSFSQQRSTRCPAKSLAGDCSPHVLPSLPGWYGTDHILPVGCPGSPRLPSAWRPGPEGIGQNKSLLSQARGLSSRNNSGHLHS